MARDEWSADQIAALLDSYEQMLSDDLAGRRFNKAERNRALQAHTGRTRTSIEFKLCNVSAVLAELSLPWLRGYAPRANYQRALVAEVASRPGLLAPWAPAAPTAGIGLAEAPGLWIGPPPAPGPAAPRPEHLERLVRKVDPAARDARNRALGRWGEERVLRHEIDGLTRAGRPDLARKVLWVSEELGDGAGYDILSFTPAGAERLLEVKTTAGGPASPFFLTANELEVARERTAHWRLFRLHDAARRPGAWELAPPLEPALALTPQLWRARPAG
ncbi:DUF3883 domain-containing protein [Oceanicella sp. SM1341]|uniref:DUF3883 domain-containing protein n=1 Tax=Oceanicella sp. SM1341 TaxID=1548889 RepID=UPI000E535A8F|nr:DUF3883 domain-containing protein [Oceanicella sp. SM1341]